MMFLYISMVRSSYIVIVYGMRDDVPILGALVTLLEAMVSAQYSHLVICRSGQYGHLISWSKWSAGHLVNMVNWSFGQNGHLVNVVI